MISTLNDILLNGNLAQLVLQDDILIRNFVRLLVLLVHFGNVETLVSRCINEVLADLLLKHRVEVLKQYFLQSEVDIVLVVAD